MPHLTKTIAAVPAVFAVAGLALAAHAQQASVPSEVIAQWGNAVEATPLDARPTTYQFVIDAEELPRPGPEDRISSVAWRLSPRMPVFQCPPQDLRWDRYRIEIAHSAVAVGDMSTTFADNIGAGADVVYDGPLVIPANTFPGSGGHPISTQFGFELRLDRPFRYEGGDLVVTIRHWGHGGSEEAWLDSVGWRHLWGGYWTAVEAMGRADDPEATEGEQFPFAVMQLTFRTGPLECYADCNGDNELTLDDFLCFMDEFAAGVQLPEPEQIVHYANCNGATAAPVLSLDDFLCFMDEFAQGCP